MSYLRPPLSAVSAASALTSDPVSGFLSSFPALAEFLCAVTWPDGSSRLPGTFMLLAEEGRWKGWLNDKACSRSCWLSGPSVEALLASLEAGLRTDSLEWRRARPERGRQGK